MRKVCKAEEELNKLNCLICNQIIMSEFFTQLFSEKNQKYSIIIEDTGTVAYAYLLYEKNIIGDVWLYNQIPAFDKVKWDDNENVLFLNPAEFTIEKTTPIVNDSDICLEWLFSNESELQEMKIYLRQVLLAKLSPGSKPGWSSIVIKDSPLALKL